MSFSVVDKFGNIRVNKKNGQPMKDMPDDKLGIVKQKFEKELEEKTLLIVTDQDVKDDIHNQKSFGQRFTETAFPTYAENVKNGNDGLNSKNVGAVAGDLATLIPRTVVGGLSYYTTPSNKHDKTIGEEIGTRSQDVKLDDEESIGGFNLGGRARKFVTSPEFALGVATAPLAGAGYNIVKNAPKASKVLGTIGAAGYSAGLEGARQWMSNEDIDKEKIKTAAVTGAVMEVPFTVLRELMTKVGKEQVKEIAAKAWLGGTQRKLNDTELEYFLRDPENQQTLYIALNDAIRMRDKAKSLFGGRDIPIHHVENVADKNSKVFSEVFPADNKNFRPAPFEGIEDGGKFLRARNGYIHDNANNPEFANLGNYKVSSPNERAKALTPREGNASKLEGHVTNLERFAERMPETKNVPMTKAEEEYLDYLQELFTKESNIASNANRHALPYQIEKELETKVRTQGYVSDSFNEAYKALLNDFNHSSTNIGQKAAEEFSGSRTQLNDIFTKIGGGNGSLVRKDYVSATESLMEDLNGEVRKLAGEARMNSRNDMYSATNNGTANDIYKKFISPIQTKLENRTHLNADDFKQLYFTAAKYNYVGVMDALEKYAAKLGVSPEDIAKLNKAGRVPGQLYKLAQGMRNDKPANNNIVGRAVDFLDPSGVNPVGVKAANYSQRNYQIGNWSNPSSNPNMKYTATKAVKPSIYNLGTSYFNKKEDKQ